MGVKSSRSNIGTSNGGAYVGKESRECESFRTPLVDRGFKWRDLVWLQLAARVGNIHARVQHNGLDQFAALRLGPLHDEPAVVGSGWRRGEANE